MCSSSRTRRSRSGRRRTGSPSSGRCGAKRRSIWRVRKRGILPSQMQEHFSLPQLLKAAQAAAHLQILHEVLHAEDVVVEKLLMGGRVLLHFQPELEVVFVGEVFAGHVAGKAAER